MLSQENVFFVRIVYLRYKKKTVMQLPVTLTKIARCAEVENVYEDAV